MSNHTTGEGGSLNKFSNSNLNVEGVDASVLLSTRKEESTEKPVSRRSISSSFFNSTQSVRAPESDSNGKQSQPRQFPVTSTVGTTNQAVKPKASVELTTPQTTKPQSVSATSAAPTSTIASATMAADPAEAAAAAFNQPIQYSMPSQYVNPGIQPMHMPQMTGGAHGSLYVGDLDEEITEGQLYEVFNAYGVIHNIRVCKDLRTRRSLGYAYVNFHTSDDAERALDTLNYQLLKNRPMRIMWVDRNPAIRKFGTGNVYIKNLDPSIDTRSLHETFKVFGKILSCKVVCDEYGSKGYGFIHFEKAEDAMHAIKKVNGMLINERKVYVGPHIQKKDRLSKLDEMNQSYTNIYVKNLPESTTDDSLREMFEIFGEITSVAISINNDGKFKGFGFVCFRDHESANKAVEEMHGKLIDGKNVYVTRAQKKAEREQKLKEQYEQFKEEKLKKYKNINLYIKNLDDSVTDERLLQEFSGFGVITSAKVMRDERTGNSKGFGFVCFSSPEEATKAVTEMNGRLLISKPIYVALAQRKDARRAQLSAQMQRNRLRTQQIPQISDMYQPPTMMYHPQNFAYQPQNGAPYFAGGSLMRPRWIPPHHQIHTPTPIPPGPVYLAPMSAQAISQQRHSRQMHTGQQRVSPGPIATHPGQPIVAGGMSLSNATMSSRKTPQVPSFAANPVTAPPVIPLTSRNGLNVRPVSQKAQPPYRGPSQIPDGTLPLQAPQITPLVLDTELLSTVPLEQQKRTLGEALFSAVQHLAPRAEGKVTGMLLELGNEEIINILKDPVALKAKVQEALRALDEYNKRQQQQQQKKMQPQSKQPQQNSQSPQTQSQQPQPQKTQPQQSTLQRQKQRPSRTQQPVVTTNAPSSVSGVEATEASA